MAEKKMQELETGTGDPTPEASFTESPAFTALLAEAKQEMEAILQTAREEAAQIRAVAEDGTAARSKSFTAPAVSEEKVPIRLFKDKGRYSSDVFVGVNGIGYQIQRGVTVEVPRSVAEVLEQSLSQDEATAMFIDKETERYAENPLSQ